MKFKMPEDDLAEFEDMEEAPVQTPVKKAAKAPVAKEPAEPEGRYVVAVQQELIAIIDKETNQPITENYSTNTPSMSLVAQAQAQAETLNKLDKVEKSI